MNKKNNNDSILNGVCEFVNHLLKEVLAKRCDFKELFYLPGLPVMDEELIFSMTEGLNYAQSTYFCTFHHLSSLKHILLPLQMIK